MGFCVYSAGALIHLLLVIALISVCSLLSGEQIKPEI
ncbi:MAG: lmo0937 family membrane protein [Bacteroidota bacterium]